MSRSKCRSACWLVPLALPAVVLAADDLSAQLKTPAGFTVERVAGAPQLRFPMFAAWDDRGRLYVAESSGQDLYAELVAQTRRCRVLRLEDQDGDGDGDGAGEVSLDLPIRRSLPKVGRNEPCPCGSGKKYKNCCGRMA